MNEKKSFFRSFFEVFFLIIPFLGCGMMLRAAITPEIDLPEWAAAFIILSMPISWAYHDIMKNPGEDFKDL